MIRVIDVRSLDDLGPEADLDGREIYYDVADWAPRVGLHFDTEFRPDLSDPHPTGV